jgi:uncharacterized protein (TIGR03435 family)
MQLYILYESDVVRNTAEQEDSICISAFLDRAPMKILRLAVALLLLSSTSMHFAQTPVPAKDQAPPASTGPLIVDAHPSPYLSTNYYAYRSTYYYNSINIGDRRFDMRDATILEMLALAFNREDNTILGGPAWIDFNRFDVSAMVPSLKPVTLSRGPVGPANPPANPYDQIRPVLKSMLAERFHLTYHMEDRPLPGYVATVAKDGAKLAEAKVPTAVGNCQTMQDKSTPGNGTITCTSETMAQLLSMYGGVFPHPIIDHTGLAKSYDFTIRFSFGQVQTRDEYIHILTDSFSKQLGLVIAAGDVSQPVMVVDTVDRTPTPNPPDIAKLIPPQPELEFEVATIKPAAPDEPKWQIQPLGSQISFGNYSMQELLTTAWQLPTGAMLANRPAWLNTVRYTILVKLPPDIDALAFSQNQDLIDRMLQKLLVDRFQIKYHWGEQTQDGYVLLADNPKMKKADPNSRSSCNIGPAEGEKDVRTTPDSPFDNEFHCQNVSMDQFADLVQSLARSEIRNRVPNKTGLAGSYDFTLFYTSTPKLQTQTAAAADAAKQAGDATAAPVQGVSIEDAFRKQLGLRLEKQPTTGSALVLDHIEQVPTEN